MDAVRAVCAHRSAARGAGAALVRNRLFRLQLRRRTARGRVPQLDMVAHERPRRNSRALRCRAARRRALIGGAGLRAGAALPPRRIGRGDRPAPRRPHCRRPAGALRAAPARTWATLRGSCRRWRMRPSTAARFCTRIFWARSRPQFTKASTWTDSARAGCSACCRSACLARSRERCLDLGQVDGFGGSPIAAFQTIEQSDQPRHSILDPRPARPFAGRVRRSRRRRWCADERVQEERGLGHFT